MIRLVTRLLATFTVALVILALVDVEPRRFDLDPPTVETPAPRSVPQPAAGAASPDAGSSVGSAVAPTGAPDGFGWVTAGAPFRPAIPGRGGTSEAEPTAGPAAAASRPAGGSVQGRALPSRRPQKLSRPVRGTQPVRNRPAVGSTPTGGSNCPVAAVGLATWTSCTGLASHMGPTFPDSYLALPQGRGVRARLCGAGGCVTMTSNDAGPRKDKQREGRIADLSVAVFEDVCGVPASMGLCPVTVAILGRA